jgi:lipoate---protein ligase
MNNWRLLKFRQDRGEMQMAIDESIMAARAQNKVPNTLRFFSWDPPALTIGFFQSAEEEVDLEKAEKAGVSVIRRSTGGGAVFHDKEITYTVVISENDLPGDIAYSYRGICGAVVDGLKSLGIPAVFSPINDIIVNGKKISGSGQTRKNGVILQHGTVLLDVNVEKMFSLLKVPDEKLRDKIIKTASERVCCLKSVLGHVPGIKKIENTLVKGFGLDFQAEFEESDLSKEEILMAKKLFKEKYSAKAWNFSR